MEKKCPYCAETIQAEASVCPHCSSTLEKKRSWLWYLAGSVPGIIAAVAVYFVLANQPSQENSLKEKVAQLELQLRQQAMVRTMAPKPVELRGEITMKEPDATWTAKDVLVAYMTAKTWSERMPLVLDPTGSRAQMEEFYSAGYTPPASFFVHPVDESCAVGESIKVPVDHGNSPSTYILVRTKKGFRIDWPGSIKYMDQEEQRRKDAKIRSQLEEWGIIDAVIEATVVRKYEASSSPKLDVKLTNKSKAKVDFVSMKASIYDRDGGFLATNDAIGSNIDAGQSSIVRFWFTDTEVDPNRISSWEISIDSVAVINAAGDGFDATNWFKLINKDK